MLTIKKFIDLVFIFGAKYFIFVLVLIAAIYFFQQPRAKQKELILFGVVSLPLTYLAALILGRLYYDPRPFVAGHFTPLIPHGADNGFPSDHTLLASAIAVIIFSSNKRLGSDLFLFAFLIGLSRVYVGVHHLVDILGSLVIALGMGWVSYQKILPNVKKYLAKSSYFKNFVS